MKSDTSRIIIETMVKKTLKDIKDSPERSVRNLVDMALNFSEGRFQKEFFVTAQMMLQNEQSPYYELIKDSVAHVDNEKILRFGMNLGYNSCTLGAAQIRKAEETCGYNIPWTVVMALEPQHLMENPESYHSVIAQGEKLGIHTWMLFGCAPLTETLPLVQAHPDDAFVLFCETGDISTEFLDGAAAVDYLMLAVRYAEDQTAVFDELRSREMLYSTYRYYKDEDVEEIVGGDYFYSAEQVHPMFTALVAAPDCSEAARKKVYAYLEAARKEQTFQTVLWELQCDNSKVDSIISDDSALVLFDEAGYLHTWKEAANGDCRNLFKSDLSQILKGAFPK